MDDVKPAESLGLLASLVGPRDDEAGRDKRAESALMAIAVHEGSAADDVLERMLEPSRPERIRKQAAFWMGNMRGRRGYEALSRLVREDPSDKVREHAVFALSQSDVPEAVDAMIRVAQQDASAHVRGQALFWLGQKAGKKAVSAITRALDDDPETEVKKKAVFALSQLPKEEGVPMLIEVAKSNRNPRGAEAGDVLARPIGRFARSRVLPGSAGAAVAAVSPAGGPRPGPPAAGRRRACAR